MAHESTADVGAPSTAYRWTCVRYNVGVQSGALVDADASLILLETMTGVGFTPVLLATA